MIFQNTLFSFPLGMKTALLGALLFPLLSLFFKNKGEKYPALYGFLGVLCTTVFGLLVFRFLPHNDFFPRGLFRFFLLPILLLGVAGAVHARGYLHGHLGNRTGIFWFLYNATMLSMIFVVTVNSPREFLFYWELMGLFSFGLVSLEYQEEGVFHAAWNYLLSCEGGGLLLFFAMTRNDPSPSSGILLAILLTGMIAFGLKAGFPGLHAWLPEAHPAAPAPVSALMSGAMIPLAFYGILTQTIVLQESYLAGCILLFCGLIAAPYALLLGSAQDNLKRMLAYSSVENMGIISIGFGLGLMGTFRGLPLIAAPAFAGATLHILNHAILKGSLFLGAGNVLRATESLSSDGLGGLGRRMPSTFRHFSFAAFSLCGLPPGTAFLSEFLIYFAAFQGIVKSDTPLLTIACALVILDLATTGALAALLYAKSIGAVFLGEPRSMKAENSHEVAKSMTGSMRFLTILSIILLLLAPVFVNLFLSLTPFAEQTAPLVSLTGKLSLFSLGIYALFFLLVLLRKTLPHGSEETKGPTWDCGYARPTARMAYTGTALAQPILDQLAMLLHLRRTGTKAEGLFPKEGSVTIHTDDPANHSLWRPLLHAAHAIADRVRMLQNGSLHLYLFLMVAALLILFAVAFL